MIRKSSPNNELDRLKMLGWNIPIKDDEEIFTPREIDEGAISFPSEGYSGEETNSEATGFWASERAKYIYGLLEKNGVKTLWEIGAGNGNAAIPLRNRGIEVIPIEPLRSGAVTLSKNGFVTFQATLEDLSFPDNSIGAIGAFDVLEHLENPSQLLAEIHRILQPGGIFICSVPAYQWLYSDFDISIGHFRRYSRKSINKLIIATGLETQSTMSLFGYLVIPAFFLRRIPYLLGRRNAYAQTAASSGGNSQMLHKLSPVFGMVGNLERLFKTPFGLSIILISKKPD
jgi:SAM-dependent methyltransferase